MPANVPRSYPTRRLPGQPSLEQLRKQAKDLLRQYRAGDPAAVAEVRQFERKPDPSTSALHDAQRVLAGSYGYESWPRLKAFVDGVNVAKLAKAESEIDPILVDERALLAFSCYDDPENIKLRTIRTPEMRTTDRYCCGYFRIVIWLDRHRV